MMNVLNAAYLQTGYVVGITNLPVNMMGETWMILLFATTSTPGSYIFVAGMN